MTGASDNESDHIAGQVSGRRLMGDVAELARWTKHAGTDQERRSLAYVERELAASGYRTTLISHDAYISLPVAGAVRGGGGAFAAIAHSFSRSTGPDGVTAELVAVGRGGAADFEARDVAGKIVLVEGIARPDAARLASRHRALAQIHVSPHQHLHEMCVSPVWGSPDDERRELLPTTAVVTVALDDGRRLAGAAEAGAAVTVIAEVDTGWRTTPILIAELEREGGAADEPFVLFSGHHDTWYHGVMDNGGANATMLEVARLCAQRRGSWRRGLRLAFWSGHSQGRYSSSAWYADEHWEELERRAVAHVNVDSTGGSGNTEVGDTTAAAELAAVARDVLQTEAGQAFKGGRMHRAGDQSFWGVGVPAIFGNMGAQPAGASPTPYGTGWWWHTPEDLADKMDEAVLVRDTRIYARVVWRLLAEPLLPLDYEAAAVEIVDALLAARDAVGGRLDLEPALRRAEELAAATARFNVALAELTDPAGIERANAALRALSRAVVPLAYTGGDRFGHDPALAMGTIPALDGVARLGALEPGSDEYLFLRGRMVRAVNRVTHGLREAAAVLERWQEGGR